MNVVQQITTDPRQKRTLILPDGSKFTMTMEYKAQQYGWFLTELIYGDFRITNIRMCTSPNILHQYKNQIPFGIGIFVQDNQETTLVTDFFSGRSKMMILTTDEVTQWGNILSGQVPA